MIHKTNSPLPDHVRVNFELPSCIWADRIFVVGDFNQWNRQATPMTQGRDGVWRAAVDLPAGSRTEFRYLIGNHWQTDSHADGFATTTLGAENSVVDTSLPQATGLIERLSSRVNDRVDGAFATAMQHRSLPAVSRPKERVRMPIPVAQPA